MMSSPVETSIEIAGNGVKSEEVLSIGKKSGEKVMAASDYSTSDEEEQELLIAKNKISLLVHEIDIELKKHSQTACCCDSCLTNLYCAWWDTLFFNKWVYIICFLLFGPIFSCSMLFVPDSKDNDSKLYNGNLLFLFTFWYFFTNVCAAYFCYTLWHERKFIVCVIWCGLTMGAVEHIEIFVSGTSLYNKNQLVCQIYNFIAMYLCTILPIKWAILPWIYNFEQFKYHKIVFVCLVIICIWASWYDWNLSFINPVPLGDTIEWHYIHSFLHFCLFFFPGLFLAIKHYYNKN